MKDKGIKVCISGRKSRKKAVKYDKRRYKRRTRIEIMFGRLKDWRRVATRYDRCPETLTDMQRAARFLYLQRLAFGGKVSGKNFGLSTDRSSRFNLTTLEPDLEALHSRLSGVTVTCMDFADFIRRVDRPETLFYLDPPYWGCEGDYGKALFSRDRFEELATVLAGVKGRFILSLNDVPGVRETFKAFRFHEVKTTYTIAAKGAAPERAEVLISNYQLGGF